MTSAWPSVRAYGEMIESLDDALIEDLLAMGVQI
jgi:hypothetical protein